MTYQMEGTCGKSLHWKLDSAGNMIVSKNRNISASQYSASLDEVQDKIISLRFEEGIKYIGNEFSGFCNLKSIVFPDSLQEISEDAFCNCVSLPEVVLPKYVQSVGSHAFSDCTNLKNIICQAETVKFGSNIFRNTPWLKNQTNFVLLGNTLLTYIGNSEKVVLPDTVKNVAENAFSQNSYITELIWNHQACIIPKGCFGCCSNLTSIYLPEGVTKIDAWAFQGCEKLGQVTFPESLKKIEDSAFFQCSCLEEIKFPKLLDDIGWRAFRETSLKEVEIPNTIITLRAAFENCRMLKKAIIGEGVQTIGACAFSGCLNLDEVIMPTHVVSIGAFAFRGTIWQKKHDILPRFCIDENILEEYRGHDEKVIIPDGVLEIGNNAFTNSDITEVILPESVHTIGSFAFSECSRLRQISLPMGLEEIKERAFSGCSSLKKIFIPSNAAKLGVSIFGGANKDIMIQGEKGSPIEAYANSPLNQYGFIAMK